MIAGIFHKGSGLGNQLHRYIATRVLALDKGYDFGMVAPELFKGADFMKLDMGNPKANLAYIVAQPSGRVMPVNEYLPYWDEWNKNVYDPDINFVEDGTIIDGNFEDPKYFEHRLPEILAWLRVEPISIPDDVCLIGFRGGEYYTVPELGLPVEYFERAIEEMKTINPSFRFQVHTDDPQMAMGMLHFLLPKDTEYIRDVGLNWRAMLCTKYAIIANSSFYVLPRLLNTGLTIAPRYWNRYNIQKWEYPQNYYKQFKYI